MGNANLYVYAANDPINFADPTGLFFSLGGALTTIGNGAIRIGTAACKSYSAFRTTQTALHIWRIFLAITNGVIEAMGNPGLTTGRMDPALSRRIGFIAGFAGGLVNQYYGEVAGTAVTSLMRDVMNETFDDRPFNWRSVAQISVNAVASTGAAYFIQRKGRSTGELLEDVTDSPDGFLQFFVRFVIQWEVDTIVPAISETFVRWQEW